MNGLRRTRHLAFSLFLAATADMICQYACSTRLEALGRLTQGVTG